MRFFWAPILNILLFHNYLCVNSKVLHKNFFDLAIIGEDTIFLLTLSNSIRRIIFFPKFDPLTATGLALCLSFVTLVPEFQKLFSLY